MRYTIILIQEQGEPGYAVDAPMLPGCYSQGDTVDEAIANAREAIETHIGGMLKAGEDIPVEEEPFTITTAQGDLPDLRPAATSASDRRCSLEAAKSRTSTLILEPLEDITANPNTSR